MTSGANVVANTKDIEGMFSYFLMYSFLVHCLYSQIEDDMIDCLSKMERESLQFGILVISVFVPRARFCFFFLCVRSV